MCGKHGKNITKNNRFLAFRVPAHLVICIILIFSNNFFLNNFFNLNLTFFKYYAVSIFI